MIWCYLFKWPIPLTLTLPELLHLMFIIFLKKGLQTASAKNASKFVPTSLPYSLITLHACRLEHKKLVNKDDWDKKRRFIYSLTTATGTLHGHLERYHEQEVIMLCQRKGWPIQLPKYKAQQALVIQGRVPFSQEAVLDGLVKFIAVNDQVSISFLLADYISNTIHLFRVSTLLKVENFVTCSHCFVLITPMQICPIEQNYVPRSLKHRIRLSLASKLNCWWVAFMVACLKILIYIQGSCWCPLFHDWYVVKQKQRILPLPNCSLAYLCSKDCKRGPSASICHYRISSICWPSHWDKHSKHYSSTVGSSGYREINTGMYEIESLAIRSDCSLLRALTSLWTMRPIIPPLFKK